MDIQKQIINKLNEMINDETTKGIDKFKNGTSGEYVVEQVVILLLTNLKESFVNMTDESEIIRTIEIMRYCLSNEKNYTDVDMINFFNHAREGATTKLNKLMEVK